MFSLLSHPYRYVGGKLKQQIIRVGPEKVFAVVFDGGTDFAHCDGSYDSGIIMVMDFVSPLLITRSFPHHEGLLQGKWRHCGIE